MQKIILFFILGCAFTAEAQYGYGTGQRQRQRQRIQTPQKAQDPNFDIEEWEHEWAKVEAELEALDPPYDPTEGGF